MRQENIFQFLKNEIDSEELISWIKSTRKQNNEAEWDKVADDLEFHKKTIKELLASITSRELSLSDKQNLINDYFAFLKDTCEKHAASINSIFGLSNQKVVLILDLILRIWKIEEKSILNFFDESASTLVRIDEGRDIAISLYLFIRQGRALLKLAALLNSKQEGKLANSIHELSEKVAVLASDLGPYWIKLIQTLGAVLVNMDGTLKKVFENFHDNVGSCMGASYIECLMKEELRAPVDKYFLEFNYEPFASATIAQVHEAKILIDGKEQRVAVKIKKPFIEKELMWNLRVNDCVLEWVVSTKFENTLKWLPLIKSQLDGLGHTFQQELDFIRESNTQSLFYSYCNSNIKIPRILHEFCTKNIIVMEYVDSIEKLEFSLNKEMLQKHKMQKYGSNPSGIADKYEDLSEGKETINDLFEFVSVLHSKHGYTLGPQYMQLVRALAPPLSLIAMYYSSKKKLVDSKCDINNRYFNELDKKRIILLEFIWEQIVYMRELHSDLHSGNLYQDKNGCLVVFDFGQTVNTKGIIVRPVILLIAFLMDWPKLFAKTLLKMGRLESQVDRMDFINDVKKYMEPDDGVDDVSDYHSLLNEESEHLSNHGEKSISLFSAFTKRQALKFIVKELMLMPFKRIKYSFIKHVIWKKHSVSQYQP